MEATTATTNQKVPCPCGSGELVGFDFGPADGRSIEVEACTQCQAVGIVSRSMCRSWGLSFRPAPVYLHKDALVTI